MTDLFIVILKAVIKASSQKDIYKLISLSIQAKNLISVRFAKKNIQGQEGWKFIKELIQAKSHLNVKYAALNLQKMATWRHIWGFILEKNLFVVNSMVAIKILLLLDTWSIIRENIQIKDRSPVLFANNLSWELLLWRFIWIDTRIIRIIK